MATILENATKRGFGIAPTLEEQIAETLDPLNITQMDEFFEELENGEVEW